MPIEPVQMDLFSSFEVHSPPKERISPSQHRATLRSLLSEDLDFHGEDSSYATHNFHASISCKWTIRSDRSQNTRTEALNLIRNRKGKTPHISCVTAEPMPTRLASLAMGTGDIDCVYHMALRELIASVKESGNEDQGDMLDTLVDGKRMRDISDLPFDLVS